MKNKIILLLVLLIPSLCFGNTSKELAQKGQLFWLAFTCSHIAKLAEDADETKRLLEIGLREGRIFIKAVKKNKISKLDIYENVPLVVMDSFKKYRLGSQSTDFILGSIYSKADQDAIRVVFGSHDKYLEILKEYNPEKREANIKLKAKSSLRRRNTWLIK